MSETRIRRFLSSLARPFGKRSDAAETEAETETSDEADAPTRTAKERSPFYLAGLLGGFCLVGAALLASGFQATEGAIADRQKEDLLTSLSLVIPASLHDNDLVADSYAMALPAGGSRTIYPATKGGVVAGVAYEVIGQGYGGAIRILMGLDRNGTILGVRVLQHAETPGLGDKVEATKSFWVNTFSGTSLTSVPESQWAVKKDGGRFDQFSGATITPRAVVKAVHDGLVFFRANRDKLVNPGKEKS